MTIPSTPRKAGPYAGNGSQTTFPFAFKVFQASDVEVRTFSTADGEQVLNPANYTVTINENQDVAPGGAIVYPANAEDAPLAAGVTLTALGALEYDQPLDLPSGGRFSDVSIENELDRIVMQIQQVAEVADRSVKLSATSSAEGTVLPVPEANKAIGWNSDGTALVNLDQADLAGGELFADWHTDTFAGAGITTFALTYSPSALSSTWVYVDGVSMVPVVDFDLSGNNLIFTVAPASGAEILARYGRIVRSEPVGREVYRAVATAGQSVFTISGGYLSGQNAIAVYVNGLRMESGGVDFTEVNDTTVAFTSGLQAGDSVVFVVGTETLGGSTIAWSAVSGKPSTFAPSAHGHSISEVTGLAASLDGKQATLVSGTNIKTINGTSLLGSGNITVSGGASTASAVSFTPAGGVSATNVQAAIQELDTEKQAALVSGTNIKTINGTTLLGSGDIAISGGGTLTADAIVTALTADSGTKNLTWSNSGTESNLYLRREANYTGGNVGYVYGAMYLETFTPTGTHNAFEWGLTSVMHSRSIKSNVSGGTSGEGFGTAPQNVAINGTAFRTAGDAPIWGGNFVAYHKAGAYTGAQGPLHGVEVNVGGNGVDVGENSIGLFVVPQLQSDYPGPGVFEGWTGVWIIGDATSNSRWRTGITNQGGRERGYHDRGNHIVAIDLADSANTDSALRIKANDWIALDGNSQVKFRYNSSNGYLEFFNGTTRRGYINMTSGADGDLAAGGGSAPANMVTTDTTQTITGAKTFNGITASSVTVSGASRYIGQTIASYYNLSAFGGANAKAFTDGTTLNIDTICTDGVIRTYMSSTPTNVQVESVMRPLYCIVSTLVKELQDKKVI